MELRYQSPIDFMDDQAMKNWRNSVTAILNTRYSPYPYITPVLFTLHRRRPFIRRARVKREDYMIRGNGKWER